MTPTITPAQADAIRAQLAGRRISAGLGTAEAPCSVEAINLALTGRLTDKIPDCMSPVIGHWIIVIQDAMPGKMRNSAAWRSLLPLAAGTGRERETERLAIIMDWMWSTVLPSLQTLADDGGYGDSWRSMCVLRTPEAAQDVAQAAKWVDRAAEETIDIAKMAIQAVISATTQTTFWKAGWGAAQVAVWLDEVAPWQVLDPCAVLARLIAI